MTRFKALFLKLHSTNVDIIIIVIELLDYAFLVRRFENKGMRKKLFERAHVKYAEVDETEECHQ